MRGENEKSWYWDRRDAMSKRVALEGYGDVPVRQPTRIESVKLYLRWGRAVQRLQLEYVADAGETDISLFFGIPWVFGFYLTLNCTREFFKRKYPELIEHEASTETGFSIDSELVCLRWGYYDDGQWIEGRKTPGWSYLNDWEAIFKGRWSKCTRGLAVLAYETTIPVELTRATTHDDNVPRTVLTHFKVYATDYTWRYPRWFPKTVTRYSIVHDQSFWVNDKQGEWAMTSHWNEETQSGEWTSGIATTPKEALEQYLKYFYDLQNPAVVEF